MAKQEAVLSLAALCLLAVAVSCEQVLAPGSSTGPLTADGFSVEVECPYDVANVFIILDPTLDVTNATFSTEVMLTFDGENVWQVPSVVNIASGPRNWTFSSCTVSYPIMAGTWGLQLLPINFPGGETYEIGYTFGVGNETLDERGQEAKMYTEKAVYEYAFESSYSGVADLELQLWGDEFGPDYLSGVYIGKTDCPLPGTAVASYTDFSDWDGQPISITVPGATHGNWFVVLHAENLDVTTTGPWPIYSVSMTYTVEVVDYSPVDDGDVSSYEGEDNDDGDEDGDGDGDGDGIQTWEVVLIIGFVLIAMLVCGGLALFAYMKYKAWQFDRQWDDPVYDSY